jgi:choline kinase
MMKSIKHAIILAAGQGRRLWPYTKDRPKCLLEVGGKTILEHQLEALRSQCVDHITVVTGYLGHRVRDIVGKRVRCVQNAQYATTSSMYSLWLARDVAVEGCIILNADVLFHAGILQSLLESPHPDAIAVDFDAVLDEEETKVLVVGERVSALSKTLPRGDAENVGMLKFSPQGSSVLFAKIRQLLQQNYRQEMVPYALNALAPTHFLAAIPVRGLPWIEIDFPADYQRACDVIYPAILKDRHASLSLSGLASRYADRGHG